MYLFVLNRWFVNVFVRMGLAFLEYISVEFNTRNIKNHLFHWNIDKRERKTKQTIKKILFAGFRRVVW